MSSTYSAHPIPLYILVLLHLPTFRFSIPWPVGEQYKAKYIGQRRDFEVREVWKESCPSKEQMECVVEESNMKPPTKEGERVSVNNE